MPLSQPYIEELEKLVQGLQSFNTIEVLLAFKKAHYIHSFDFNGITFNAPLHIIKAQAVKTSFAISDLIKSYQRNDPPMLTGLYRAIARGNSDAAHSYLIGLNATTANFPTKQVLQQASDYLRDYEHALELNRR
jgi:hypothetical protein